MRLFKIFEPRCKTIIKKNTLAYMAVNEWNALPNDVIEAENINQFKSKLEEYYALLGEYNRNERYFTC